MPKLGVLAPFTISGKILQHAFHSTQTSRLTVYRT